MKIAGYLRTSLIEWPGRISSVIFVPGCNFRCPFCHNAELVDPQKIKKLSLLSTEEVLLDLRNRKKWIDGVVITGGEPTLQKDLGEFLRKCRKLGFGVMLETNGSCPEVLKKVLTERLVDFVALDFKTSLKQYSWVVGAKFNSDSIRQTLKILAGSGVDFELRTTVAPGIHNRKILEEMAKELKKILRSQDMPWIWQNFQPKNCLDKKFRRIRPFGVETMKGWRLIAMEHFPNLKIIE